MLNAVYHTLGTQSKLILRMIRMMTTIEPPELVAERILTYARIMWRENVIAGTDCGYGNRVYPDIGWAKMRSGIESAELASKQLWPRGS